MTGAYSQRPSVSGCTWDAWSHYHIMYGLYLWYQETQDPCMWDALLKISGFFIRNFYTGKRRLGDIGSLEMNLAPLHIFALLYLATGDEQFLKFAKEIEKDLTLPAAGNYITNALNGVEFYKCPKPRWESLHIVMGIAAMYSCTNDEKYRIAAEQIFYSILKSDVHNTGAFSTEEQAVGTPFINGNIELCCVIAYNALGCDILKINNDTRIADFLELSLYNAVMGSFSPTGRWSTYSTPMEGSKVANYQSIVFQSRPGSPELNCCSANSARGVGMLSDWAVMEDSGTVYLNYFGTLTCRTASGLDIQIEGDYPACGNISIVLKSESSRHIAIRIPAWSKHTTVLYGGKEEHPKAGTYWLANNTWVGDPIKIQFDFAPHLLEGGGDYTGKQSIYMGPILYGYDISINEGFDFDHLPPVSLNTLQMAVPEKKFDGRFLLKLSNGMVLCDFYHLGTTGSVYKT